MKTNQNSLCLFLFFMVKLVCLSVFSFLQLLEEINNCFKKLDLLSSSLVSLLLSYALQTSQVLHISMNAQLTYEPNVLQHFRPDGIFFFSRDLFDDVMSVHNWRNVKWFPCLHSLM